MSEEVNWEEKYLGLHEKYSALSKQCRKVIEKHEDLLDRYKKNEAQYDLLVQKLEEREKELKDVQKVLEPAYVEYECIKEKYQEAVECQKEAESYASNVTKEYKNLKRKSQMVFCKANLTLPDDPAFNTDVVETATDKYLKEKTEEIIRLKQEKATLHAELTSVQEDLQIEKDNCNLAKKKEKIMRSEVQRLQHSLEQHKLAIHQLSRVSEAALQEYETLKSEYELEAVCRNKAETFASKLLTENNAIKRQSSILLQSVSSDTRLMRALNDVEDLTAELEMVKTEYQKEVKELKEEIASLTDSNRVVSLEEENSVITEDRDLLQKQLLDFQEQYNSLESQYKTLQAQCEDVRKKYEKAIQPPPPPPPPPLPPSTSRTGFLSKFKKKKVDVGSKLVKGGAQVNEGYSKALDEMMKRIKDGKPLNKVLKQTGLRNENESPPKAGAMEELHTILNNMKRSRSNPDLLAPIEKENSSSELASVFKRIRSSDSKNDEPDTDVFQPASTPVISPPVAKPRTKTLSAVQEEPVDES
ncbi:shootin-1-like [Gigantopelta aegis]|uniref:shootin-1-like n=1 Tax=Gigantopelta aegis TaxID=1735272 RepID=UPI001B88CFF9|nr:shootin-1-like [Gigantopelta aegis]